WAAQNAQTTLDIDLRRGFIVGGGSAGSNMAGAIAYLARVDGIAPPSTDLWLSLPCCLSPGAIDLYFRVFCGIMPAPGRRFTCMMVYRTGSGGFGSFRSRRGGIRMR
ncbi:hypothetical protein PG984_010554, partial [Apiospora sp. TS-2023a]